MQKQLPIEQRLAAEFLKNANPKNSRKIAHKISKICDNNPRYDIIAAFTSITANLLISALKENQQNHPEEQKEQIDILSKAIMVMIKADATLQTEENNSCTQ